MNRGLVVCVAYWTAFRVQLVALGQNFNICIKSKGPKGHTESKPYFDLGCKLHLYVTYIFTYLLTHLLTS
jgi:hypothetical protein